MNVDRITVEHLTLMVDALRIAGYADDDISWSEGLQAPTDADAFAAETIFVICNSGMKSTVACAIYRRVMPALQRGESARTVFGHPGKATAIDSIWARRSQLFTAYLESSDKLGFCESLPWIGGITKFHLAKNFGADVAKPDVHLQRLAKRGGETVHDLCARLSGESGFRVATVDLILWRACATGLLDSKTGAIAA